jgi:hypothetical protein
LGLNLSFILGSVAIWSLRIFYFYEGGFNFVPLASFKNCNFFLALVFVGLANQGKDIVVFRFIIERSSSRDLGP